MLVTSGNKIIDFNNSENLTIYNLPSPGLSQSDPNYPKTYHGEYVRRASNVCYNYLGQLLFFVIDGKVFDHEGYLISDFSLPNQILGNTLPPLFTGLGSISFTKIPGTCSEYIIVSNEGAQTFILFLDLTKQNPNFPNDPTRRGKIINLEFEPNDYTGFINQLFITWETTYPGFDYSVDGERLILLLNPSFAQQQSSHNEIVDLGIDQDKLLIAVGKNKITRLRISPQGISLLATEPLTYSGNGEGRRSSGGIEAIIYEEQLIIAITDNSSSGDGSSEINLELRYYSLSGSLQSIVGVNTHDFQNFSEAGTIGDIEFSPSGKFLYFTQSSAPYFGCVDITNNQVHYLAYELNFPYASFAGMRSSQLACNKYANDQGLFCINDGSLALLTSPDNLTLATWIQSLSSNFNNIPWISYNNGNDGYYTDNLFLISAQNYGISLKTELNNPKCCRSNHLPEAIHSQTLSTSGHTTWTYGVGNNPWNAIGPVYIDGDISIASGSSITISGMELRFAPESDFIIQPNARVRLNNGTKFTSYECENLMWQGVNVLGNPTLSQNPFVSVPPFNAGGQGMLIVNTASIENALIAVELGVNNSTSGGVLLADNATFLNCGRGLIARKYHHYNNAGLLLSNRTRLQNSKILITQALNRSDIIPGYMVALQDVDNIRIVNCSFINATDLSIYGWNQRGIGIFSLSSSFQVGGTNASWTGLDDNSHSAFVGLQVGVYAIAGGQDTYVCTKMEFQNNAFGIINQSTNHTAVTRNNFYIPSSDQQLSSLEIIPTGAFFANSTGYTVTDNSFYGNDHADPSAIGCWIHNSGPNTDQIYRNFFDHLLIGAQTEKLNASENTQRGLQWICNTFTDGTTDIHVAQNSRMRHDQGGAQPLGLPRAADNRFSYALPNCEMNKDITVDPMNDWYYNYFHRSGDQFIPDCESFSAVVGNGDYALLHNYLQITSLDYNMSCASILSNGPSGLHLLSVGGLQQANARVLQLQAQLEDQRVFLDQTLNQGDGRILLDELHSAFPLESYALRNLMLEKYPLSEEVLIEVVRQMQRFNPWHFTEIILANMPLDPDLYANIMALPNLAAFYKSFIETGQSAGEGSIALRHILEMHINELEAERFDLMNKMTTAHLCPAYVETDEQEMVIHKESADALWHNEFTNFAYEAAVRDVVLSFMAEGNWEQAMNLAASAPSEWKWDDFLNLIQFLKGVGLNYEAWGQSDINDLMDFYVNHDNRERYFALALLHLVGASYALPIPMMPMHLRSVKGKLLYAKPEVKLLSVYPTITNTEIYIEAPVEAGGIGQIEIVSTDGKIVNKTLIPSGNTLLRINVGDYPTGMYIIQLITNGISLASEKFTVIK